MRIHSNAQITFSTARVSSLIMSIVKAVRKGEAIEKPVSGGICDEIE